MAVLQYDLGSEEAKVEKEKKGYVTLRYDDGELGVEY